MNKNTVQYPDMFDVFSIEYKSGCKCLAFAPTSAVSVGDRVVTPMGQATVMGRVGYVTTEDEWFKLVSAIYSVDRITDKIIEVK